MWKLNSSTGNEEADLPLVHKMSTTIMNYDF